MDKEKMLKFLDNKDELLLIDLMTAYLLKEGIIDTTKGWEDDVFK